MRIETDRLILRNYKMLDIIDYIKLMTQEKVAFRAGFDIKSNEKLVQELKDECLNELKFAIEVKGSNGVIGEVGLNSLSLKTMEEFGVKKDERVMEVEFCLSEEYWNNGYMTEAMMALVKLGFEELSLDTIVGASYTKNLASKKVQIKCGLIPFKTNKNYLWRETGETCKVVLSKMTKEQYEHIKSYKKLKIKVIKDNKKQKNMEQIRKIIEASKNIKEL